MTADRVARHQKARLQGAMVEAVSRHGYASTTLRELVTLAGVSKSTFYEHFESKEDCFLSTFDEIVAQLSARVGEAYRSEGDDRQRLTAGLNAFMSLAVEEPAAASLAAIESLTLGAAGVAHRERASRAFEALIQQSFDHSPSKRSVSPPVVRGIVAGIRGVSYRRLRIGRGEELPGEVGNLVDWALRYQEPDTEVTLRAIEAAIAPRPVEDVDPAEDPPPGWDEPPDSRLSRSRLTQRERIVRAAARVVVESGYQALSIPAISGAAGVSNQTFYEHFASKRDAFLAAFEVIAAEALTRTADAFAAEGRRPEAIGAGLRALLDYVAESALFAQLAFFELPTAGPVALDRADEMFDGFSAFLEPDTAPPELGEAVPRSILEAIPSAVWAVIQHEIVHGRREVLPELAPEIVRIVLAPFNRP
ncbi:MAG: TetR/AcrR family transcriptional regulator [Thermoleophilia bacterium]|nr:TetR/AcrR family transcriptional regulator [Thermoleophilia bacterium]